MKDAFEFLFCIVVVVLALVLGFVVGGNTGTSSEKGKAVTAGVGRHSINPTNGETTFIYGCIHTNK